MGGTTGTAGGAGVRVRDRVLAILLGLSRRRARLAAPPEPRALGRPGRGGDLLAGRCLVDGRVISAPDLSIWDRPRSADAAPGRFHDFAWLSDLASEPSGTARDAARDWTMDWIGRFGSGRGPGWTPDLVAARLLGWIDHADWMFPRPDGPPSRLERALTGHVRFLLRRSDAAPPGFPAIRAAVALVEAGIRLNGPEGALSAGQRRLEIVCAREVTEAGAIASRNPEELMSVLCLLARAAETLERANQRVGPAHAGALLRIAPVLRGLRHGGGALPRFHGGGAGPPGQLDLALAATGMRPGRPPPEAMGFRRLAHGRTTVMVDAAAPPTGPASHRAHASTLAFEMSSGRRPIIVNCGSGAAFGAKWERAGRATSSHSTLVIDGHSSARIAPREEGPHPGAPLIDVPGAVHVELRRTVRTSGLIASHDGWRRTHGLTHLRQLHLDRTGRELRGEDVLTTLDRADEARLGEALQGAGGGIAFRLRFHLHPSVEPSRPDAQTVALGLPSREVWHLRHGGAAELRVEPGIWMEAGLLQPRASWQVVLVAVATTPATRVSWSLAKSRETPDALRDDVPAEMAMAE